MGVIGTSLEVLGPGIVPGVRRKMVLHSDPLSNLSDSLSLSEKLTYDEEDEDKGMVDI